MSFKIKNGGVWKDAAPSVKHSGAWKTPSEIWAKNAGVWEKVWVSEQTFSWYFDAEDNGKGSVQFTPDTSVGEAFLYTSGTAVPFLGDWVVPSGKKLQVSAVQGTVGNTGAINASYLGFALALNDDTYDSTGKSLIPLPNPINLLFWNETKNNQIEAWTDYPAKSGGPLLGEDAGYWWCPQNVVTPVQNWDNNPVIGDRVRLDITI